MEDRVTKNNEKDSVTGAGVSHQDLPVSISKFFPEGILEEYLNPRVDTDKDPVVQLDDRGSQ